MINPSQHKINTAYNQFLTKLVLWNGLNNRLKADQEQGYKPSKNKEKMLTYQAQLEALLPEIEQLDRADIKSYYPLIDDLALIQIFKDTVQ